LTLQLTVDGNFTFQPQIEIPAMDGFQIRGGPRQGSSYNWVNGVVKQQATVQWELVPLKSGRLSIGPFKASAKDAAQGEVAKTAPAIIIQVAKASGFALPPTPTPEPDAAPDPSVDELREIRGDLGFPWARAAVVAGIFLLILGLIAWWALRTPPPKKVEIVRDPGQQALLELEKARLLLVAGDEAAYYKELGRIIRFYLRHRMRMPEKELTLYEAQRLMEQALMKGGEAQALEGRAALERLQELLFAGAGFEAKDASELSPAMRRAILALEKDAHWSEEELVKTELDRIAEVMAPQGGEAHFQAMLKCFKAYLSRREERIGKEALQSQLAAALEEMGPAATSRVGYVLLSRRLREELDLEKLNRDLQKLSELLEKGVNHGKRK
jgi:hypothetical protein